MEDTLECAPTQATWEKICSRLGANNVPGRPEPKVATVTKTQVFSRVVEDD